MNANILPENIRFGAARLSGIVSGTCRIDRFRTALYAVSLFGEVLDDQHALDIMFELEVVTDHLKLNEVQPRDWNASYCPWRAVSQINSVIQRMTEAA